MFYGLYRGIGKPEVSIILTVISLGTRDFYSEKLLLQQARDELNLHRQLS